MSKDEQVKRFTDQILNRVKNSFENHRRRIDKFNSEKTYPGGLYENQTAQSFYGPINDLVKDLKTLLALVKKSQKLRKQRRTLYDKKITGLIETLQMIRKNRQLIKIKINDSLIKLTTDTSDVIQKTTANLRNFDKQAGIMCGKSWDFKPLVESSMTQLAQYGFLWANLEGFQSITSDSVKQIHIPVNYDQKQFESIINQVKAIWPNPQIIKKEIIVPQIQIKDDSQLRQAHQMLFGFTRSQNVAKAIQIYHQQVEKPNCHPSALNALGDIYQNGKFAKKDLNKSVKFYKKSADKNDPEGLYKIGQFLQKGIINSKQIFEGLYPNRQAEIRGGIQFYEKAAKLGHLDAMTDLGYIYQKGVKNQSETAFFIQPYPEHALKYYLKTKKSDFPRGYNNLGALLITCPTLSEEAQGGNTLKGIKYLQKAIDLKYPRSYLNLGKCFQNGVGVVQNLDKARALYLIGAELGDAQCKLQYIKSCLGFRIDDEKTLIKMVELDRQLLMEDCRNPEALYYMGLFLEQGIGIDKNIESSLHYINTAARMQYPPAITKLADFYYTGLGVKKDVQYARMLYQKGASKGDSKALINLGVMMEKGIGYPQRDTKRAYEMYQQAAAMGNPDALIILSTTGSNQMKPSQAVNKANQMGSLEAAKILKSTNIFAPLKQKTANSYTATLKTLQNFYMKSNATKRRA